MNYLNRMLHQNKIPFKRFLNHLKGIFVYPLKKLYNYTNLAVLILTPGPIVLVNVTLL